MCDIEIQRIVLESVLSGFLVWKIIWTLFFSLWLFIIYLVFRGYLYIKFKKWLD